MSSGSESDLALKEKFLSEEYPGDAGGASSSSNDNKCFTVLNEVVIDRGDNPSMVDLDVYCDGEFVTKVLADGIIIGTPNGSTAYSLSAGGSMVHPSVPAILFTPICPHSLSFRPMLFPDSAAIEIKVPFTSRNPVAKIVFDGKRKRELRRGESVYIKTSPYPVPMVCRADENQDWFFSVKNGLHWNVRTAPAPKLMQAPPPTGEESPTTTTTTTTAAAAGGGAGASGGTIRAPKSSI